jgi:hypothetical protein
VWRMLRRLQWLEGELAQAKADQAELRQRLRRFEMIAAAAGAAGPAAPPEPVPPTLLAAARDLRDHDVPVRLRIGDAEVVAVVGGEGDPRKWWAAIWELAGPAGEAS